MNEIKPEDLEAIREMLRQTRDQLTSASMTLTKIESRLDEIAAPGLKTTGEEKSVSWAVAS